MATNLNNAELKYFDSINTGSPNYMGAWTQAGSGGVSSFTDATFFENEYFPHVVRMTIIPSSTTINNQWDGGYTEESLNNYEQYLNALGGVNLVDANAEFLTDLLAPTTSDLEGYYTIGVKDITISGWHGTAVPIFPGSDLTADSFTNGSMYPTCCLIPLTLLSEETIDTGDLSTTVSYAPALPSLVSGYGGHNNVLGIKQFNGTRFGIRGDVTYVNPLSAYNMNGGLNYNAGVGDSDPGYAVAGSLTFQGGAGSTPIIMPGSGSIGAGGVQSYTNITGEVFEDPGSIDYNAPSPTPSRFMKVFGPIETNVNFDYSNDQYAPASGSVAGDGNGYDLTADNLPPWAQEYNLGLCDTNIHQNWPKGVRKIVMIDTLGYDTPAPVFDTAQPLPNNAVHVYIFFEVGSQLGPGINSIKLDIDGDATFIVTDPSFEQFDLNQIGEQ